MSRTEFRSDRHDALSRRKPPDRDTRWMQPSRVQAKKKPIARWERVAGVLLAVAIGAALAAWVFFGTSK